MEPEASQAAISAIAALQKRVRELEEQSGLLEDERDSLRLRLNDRDFAYQRREAALNDAASKAKEILNNASVAMSQLREARTERQKLKAEVEDLERQIHEIQSKIKSTKSGHRRTKSGLTDLLRKLAEYEILIGDVVAQPPYRPCLSPDEASLLASREADPDVLPPSLGSILRNLQGLPKSFTTLNLGKKREVVKVLSEASAAVTELNAKIRNLEREKFASSTPKKFDTEIKRLSSQMFILSNEIRKFEFG
jgi:peptidoglycan hydrolase CwlO-like protein